MTLTTLESLTSSGLLKPEPPDQRELTRMLDRAKSSLRDAKVEGVSEGGRFLFVYEAAHELALAALRQHGYRTDKRYLVFQCLEHTVGFPPEKWRVFDSCHRRRNLAVYEGYMDVPDNLLSELLELTYELLRIVEAPPPQSRNS